MRIINTTVKLYVGIYLRLSFILLIKVHDGGMLNFSAFAHTTLQQIVSRYHREGALFVGVFLYPFLPDL